MMPIIIAKVSEPGHLSLEAKLKSNFWPLTFTLGNKVAPLECTLVREY